MTANSTITKALYALALLSVLIFPNFTFATEVHSYGAFNQNSFIAVLLCLGFLIACTAYCAYVAIDSGERSYIYYVFCTASLIWVWCEIVGFIAPVGTIPLAGGYVFICFAALFAERFLFLTRYAPKLSGWFKIGAMLSLLCIFLGWLLPEYYYWLVAVLFSVLVTAIFFGALRSFKGGMTSALFCFAAYLMVLLAYLAAGWLDTPQSEQFSTSQVIVLVVGCISYTICLAFALVGKFIAIARRNIASSENLEQKILERTEQLQSVNHNLEKLAEDLQGANAAKSTFLVNMSHEMRTPLTAIIGYADGIAQGDIAADEQTKAMAVIRKNGEHLLDIINDLLDIAKIESDTLEVENRPFDPLAMIHQLSQLVSADVERKALKFTVLYRLPLPCEMVSDAKRVRQILLNIINNAVKFTHQGEVEVMVKAEQSKLTFSIADTGIGMNADQLEMIFQAFSQEDLTKSRQYGGAGLGLNIAKSLANKLGAQIEVTSTQGQGSTFTVTFDLAKSSSTAWLNRQNELDAWLNKVKNQDMEVQQVDVPVLQGNVLLAEDHPDNQVLFVRMLERMGLRVTAVDNGYKAVQATLDNDFDLILMDIQMPEMDGIKAFELIQGTCSHVPVVALTANAMKADVALYKGLGFKDHIAKPVDRKIFVDTVNKYLDINEVADVALEGDEMDEIKQQYVTRLVNRVADIKQAKAAEDWQDIGKHAHAIKGSAGMFGFDDLGALGAQLELDVKQGDLSVCEQTLEQLLDCCERVIKDAH